jgi:hypothetical protein
MQQLGNRVGAQSRVALEHACGFRGRGDAEHGSPLRGEVGDGGAQGAGLAGAGRPDDEHEPVVSGDGGGGVGLEYVKAADVDRRRGLRVGGLGVHGPGEHAFFLGEHGLAGEVWRGWLEPHRAAIGAPSSRRRVLRVELHAACDDLIAQPLQRDGPLVAVEFRHRALGVADRTQDVGSRPG